MKLDARAAGRTMKVEVRRDGDGFAVTVDGRRLDDHLVRFGDHFASLLLDGHSFEVGLERRDDGFRVHLPRRAVDVGLDLSSGDGAARPRKPSGPTRLTAPMPGRVVRVLAEEGREVQGGEGLVVIEAMKMENELKAPRPGRVDQVAVREGQAVEAGALLLVVA